MEMSMELMADILADTKRYRAEAIQALTAIKNGVPPNSGTSPEEAIQILKENIEIFESVLRRYGWRDDA